MACECYIFNRTLPNHCCCVGFLLRGAVPPNNKKGNLARERKKLMPAKNAHTVWTKEQVKLALKLIKQNTPTGLIAHKLGRTEDGIRSKMSDLNVSLKPINKSPYNRRDK